MRVFFDSFFTLLFGLAYIPFQIWMYTFIKVTGRCPRCLSKVYHGFGGLMDYSCGCTLHKI